VTDLIQSESSVTSRFLPGGLHIATSPRTLARTMPVTVENLHRASVTCGSYFRSTMTYLIYVDKFKYISCILLKLGYLLPKTELVTQAFSEWYFFQNRTFLKIQKKIKI
jgi:hypothetical protein